MANTLDKADTECFPHHTVLLDNDALDKMFKITFIYDTILYNRIIIAMLKNKSCLFLILTLLQ